MKTVEAGNHVKLHYIGTLSNGEEFDNSHKRGQLMEVKVGHGLMIPGFEKALIGMTEGETKTVNISPEEAYGHRNPTAQQVVGRDNFPPDYNFTAGTTVQGNGPMGPVLATILSWDDATVTLDMNHPLAGESLNFEIKMVEIESNLTAEETNATTTTEST